VIATASLRKISTGSLKNEPINAKTFEKMNELNWKYIAARNPIKPPIKGKRNINLADVSTNSSPLPMGIIVRKASKSLKVFIAFNLDIYPIHSFKLEYRLCCDEHGGN
jgi:hypothetical protein